MINYNRLASMILLYAMFVGFVINLLFKVIPSSPYTFLAGFIFTFLIFIFLDKKRIDSKYKILVTISVWFHLLGIIYLYSNFEYYDKAIHFINSYFITLIVYDYFIKNINIHPKKTPIFLILLGILAIWEIYEYSLDTLLNFYSQGVFNSSGQVLLSPLDDTMQDLIIGCLGSIFCLIFKKNKNII